MRLRQSCRPLSTHELGSSGEPLLLNSCICDWKSSRMPCRCNVSERFLLSAGEMPKKRCLNRRRTFPSKSLCCGTFFARGVLHVSNCARRICDGCSSLAGFRHNNGRKRKVLRAPVSNFGLRDGAHLTWRSIQSKRFDDFRNDFSEKNGLFAAVTSGSRSGSRLGNEAQRSRSPQRGTRLEKPRLCRPDRDIEGFRSLLY